MTNDLLNDFSSRGTVRGGFIARERAALDRAEERRARFDDPTAQAVARVRAAMMALRSVEDTARREHEVANRLVACPLTGRPVTLHPSVRDKLLAVLAKHAPEIIDAGSRPLPGVETVEQVVKRLARDAQAELAEADAARAALGTTGA